eukprot:7378995-Prymnesium_polylepis.1
MGRRATRVWRPVARLAASRGNTPLPPPMAGVQGALPDRSATPTHSPLLSTHNSTQLHASTHCAPHHLRPTGDTPIGEIERMWYRHEEQGRGSLHVHAAIWVRAGTARPEAIYATAPRGPEFDPNALPGTPASDPQPA